MSRGAVKGLHEGLTIGNCLQAAETQREQLEHANLGRDVRLGLLHGRMKPADKTAAMTAFAQGNTPVLVSTSVVEVRETACWLLPCAALVVAQHDGPSMADQQGRLSHAMSLAAAHLAHSTDLTLQLWGP